MENRYKLPKDLQIKYFRIFESKSKMNTEKIAVLFGVVSRSYRDWRRGKYAIPRRVVTIIENTHHIPFPLSKNITLAKWRADKIIAGRMGAKAVLAKYGALGSPEGRSKGGKRGIQVLRERGLIPQPKPFHEPRGYSVELAEFVGILLGDGHVGKEQWSIALNLVKDREYSIFVKKLITNLFKFTPSVLTRNDCHVIIIQGSGMRSIQYFVKLGLKIGNKVKQQVGVPDWIQKNPLYRIACVRGMVDTDGGIFHHTYKVNGKIYSYKKLAFVNRSVPLLHFVRETLQNLELTPKLIDKVENKRVWLYNQSEVAQYLKIVGTHNSRLLK
jgi:intein/homing endonuclease